MVNVNWYICNRRYIAMLGMCRIVGHRSQLIMLLLLLSQNLMNIILAHFQDRYATYFYSLWWYVIPVPLMHFLMCSSYAHDHRRSQKAIAYDTSLDAKEDMHSLCGELVSVLERLELLSEVCCLNWCVALDRLTIAPFSDLNWYVTLIFPVYVSASSFICSSFSVKENVLVKCDFMLFEY